MKIYYIEIEKRFARRKYYYDSVEKYLHLRKKCEIIENNLLQLSNLL